MNDLQIQPNERILFSNEENKYSLVISKCDLSDNGEYKALLKNDFGEAQSKCRLNVSPNMEELSKNSPHFVELLRDMSVNEGQDVCFKCKVTGIPQPNLKWFKDGQEIEESERIKVGFSYRVIHLAKLNKIER